MKLPQSDKNSNRYYDYVGGQPEPTAQPVQQQVMQNLQNGSTASGSQNPQSQRRPLNDEERRRLEAARQAAIRSGRISEDELRRRRTEQQILRANQPQAVETAPGDVSRGKIQPERASLSPKRRKRRSIHVPVGVILFAALIAGVTGVSVWQIGKNDVAHRDSAPYSFQEAVTVEDLQSDLEQILSEEPTHPSEVPETIPAETDESASPSPETAPTDSADLPETAEEPESVLTSLTVPNDALDEGALILVNYEHPYAEADSVTLTNAYEARAAHNGKLKISTTDAAMEVTAFAALEELVKGLEADTGCDDLMINSGHRTIAEQQRIYDSYLQSNGQEYVDAYVALPGYSEHHTGLACDLTFYLDEGYSVPISEHEFGFWMNNSPANYGFIRRYPEDKVEITHINYEAWHFRYVGVPHAYACTALNLCLEEYIDYLKDFTADTKMLYVKSDSTVEEVAMDALPTSGGWLIGYAPAAEGSETVVPIPDFGTPEVSGNNVDGFVVTVTLP